MRIHHLNCGCMCPLGGALFDGFSRGLTARLVCHCLLIETDNDGLVLVDTGFGSQDVKIPSQRLSGFFRYFNNIRLEHRYTALEQVRQLGFSPTDVRHIVLTHLDFDHAGGLEDFPQATVHVLQAEMDAARQASGWRDSRRFRRQQWDRVGNWAFYQPEGERWNGFGSVRTPLGTRDDILLIPLPGHTPGHAGIAVRTAEGWLLHAGDAYFYRGEVGTPERLCTPGLRFYQRMMDSDHAQRVDNQNRLRALSIATDQHVRMFCSHDAMELERYTS
ncbi:MBL fold metallo-hydrolase [Pseudomonas sp. DC3000-4b1]|uniref:MBL fold metallo-hydrolase n=1 Tax=unclassified Pseudomonas TaxID=196821 RepID=UPI003CE68A9B